MSHGGAKVTCAVCKKSVLRVAAVAHQGVWCHADAKCFGELMRKQPSVRDLARQLGLFSAKAKGSP